MIVGIVVKGCVCTSCSSTASNQWRLLLLCGKETYLIHSHGENIWRETVSWARHLLIFVTYLTGKHVSMPQLYTLLVTFTDKPYSFCFIETFPIFPIASFSFLLLFSFSCKVKSFCTFKWDMSHRKICEQGRYTFCDTTFAVLLNMFVV